MKSQFTLNVAPENSPPILNKPLFSQLQDASLFVDETSNSVVLFTNITSYLSFSKSTFQGHSQANLTYESALASSNKLPDFLTFDSAKLEFASSPTFGDVGKYQVEVWARSQLGVSQPDNFNLSIQLVDANSSTRVSVRAFTGQLLSLTIPRALNESSLQALSILNHSLPKWLSFDGRTLSGTPSTKDCSVSVFFTAKNTTAPYLTLDIVIDGNRIPKVKKDIEFQTMGKGKFFSWQIPPDTFWDPDGDQLTYTVEGLKGLEWLSYDQKSRTLSGTPPPALKLSKGMDLAIVAKDSHNAMGATRLTIIVNQDEALTTAIIILLSIVAIFLFGLVLLIIWFRRAILQKLCRMVSSKKEEELTGRSRAKRYDINRITKPEFYNYPFRTAAESMDRGSRTSDLLDLPPPTKTFNGWNSEKPQVIVASSYANLNGASILGVSPIVPSALDSVNDTPMHYHVSTSVGADESILGGLNSGYVNGTFSIPTNKHNHSRMSTLPAQRNSTLGYANTMGHLVTRFSRFEESTLPTLSYNSAHLIEVAEAHAFALQSFRFTLPPHLLPSKGQASGTLVEAVWRKPDTSFGQCPLPGWMHYNHYTGTIWGTPSLLDLGLVELDFYRVSSEDDGDGDPIFHLKILITD
jgi:hypothetical protein